MASNVVYDVLEFFFATGRIRWHIGFIGGE